MESKTERIVHATKTLCDETEKKGIEICSWEEMSSFDDFVDGKISEAELAEKAKEEMAQFVRKFEKYTIIRDSSSEAKLAEEKQSAKMRKVKAANRIYKKACAESGKNHCLFKNFTSWQEFVDGRIGSEEFYEKAVEEVEKLD